MDNQSFISTYKDTNQSTPNSPSYQTVQSWLDQARRAPSADNMQPWKVSLKSKKNSTVLVIEVDNRTQNHPSEIDANYSISYIALGALAQNLRIIALKDGYLLDSANAVTSESNQVTFEMVIQKTEAEIDPLLKWISKRTTNRNIYKKQALLKEHVEALNFIATENSNIQIRYRGVEESRTLIQVLKKLDTFRYNNKRIFKDFVKTLRFGKEAFTTKDGLAGPTLGVPVIARIGLFFLKVFSFSWRFNFLGMQQLSTYMGVTRLFQHSSGALVLQGKNDSPEGWFNFGYDLQKIWLELTSLGISIQPFGTPSLIYRAHLEDNNKLKNLQNLFPDKNRHDLLTTGQNLKSKEGFDAFGPLLVLRIGYATTSDESTDKSFDERSTAISFRRKIDISRPQSPGFNYDRAFSRNLGWLTQQEQEIMRASRVAIAGMGGVGGQHLLTLVRLGVTHFHIADLDTFEIENFNRQAGANMQSIGKPKVEVMLEQARLINPDVDIKVFPSGVNAANLDEFLAGVDVYADGLDAFALDTRSLVFEACYRKGIPSVTVAPIGAGAALLNFIPGKMSFKRYFGFSKDMSEKDKIARFFLGLTPSVVQKRMATDMSYFKLADRKGPSTPMGCVLSSGVLGTEILKLLTGRGSVVAAPHGLHFDAFSNSYRKTWVPFGSHNILFKLKVWAFKKIYMKA